MANNELLFQKLKIPLIFLKREKGITLSYVTSYYYTNMIITVFAIWFAELCRFFFTSEFNKDKIHRVK